MREPKKVRTNAELVKSCRMLREHNQRLKATIKRVEGLKPRTVYLDPDRLEIIEVIMFDDLVAALKEQSDDH